ncbi:hypothetical protein [Caballeronia temeraria]|uniref:hypothetical protein n=1 Tax=Caballeronia temeraria TaxID=1777137 RepID=UPI0012FE0C66|nr:hypothetical protein [Caballeronia temeraria]
MVRIAAHAIKPAAKLSNWLLDQTPPSIARAKTNMTMANGGQCSCSTRARPPAPMPIWKPLKEYALME